MRRDIMSRIATLALAAVAAVFGAVSCAEEEIEVEAPMQKVQFAAATRYDNLPATRTIYSGDEIEINGQKTERIDWVDGDRIYVRGLTCDQYIHPYSGGELTVASHQTLTGDSKVSVATLDGDANIHWAPNETNVFVAAYPSSTLSWGDDSQKTPRFMGYLPATQAQSASHTAGGQTVTNPSMDYAAMVAKESVTERPTDPVTLHFYPAFTAFEFNMAFAGASGSNTISKFEIESTTSALAGYWEWNYNSGVNSFTCSTATTYNKKITVNFDNQVIDAEHPLRFTVFALPQQITNVTVKFYLSSGTKTLSLKDKTTGVWEVFEPCKKYRISTPGAPADWEYVIECTDPSASLYTGEIPSDYTHGTVTSYKQKHDGSNKTAVEWEVEGYYEDAECATPYNGDKTQKPYWMPGYDGSTGQDEAGPGSKTGEDVGITYAHSRGDTTETITSEAQALNALIANHAQMGSSASPYNLSNPQNNGAAGYVAESANSYIVNACGWYAIPLVMGNGVKNNALNPDPTTYKGYQGTGSTSDDQRVLFKNYKGNNITNPWLNQQGGTPTSAEIVWEDIEGLIETQKDASGANTYDLPAGCISADGKWLYFHVPTVREGKYIYKDATGNTRNEPRQGNAVIAVKDASGTTMWSYHIWVTDYVPRNYLAYEESSKQDVNTVVNMKITVHNSSGTFMGRWIWELPYRLMRKVLGYTVYGTTVNRDYEEQTVYVKLKQPESGETTVMTVVQLEGHPEIAINRNQPFFQGLRLEAMWPGSGLENNYDPIWYGKYPMIETNTLEGLKTRADAIANPGKFIIGIPDNLNTSPFSDLGSNMLSASHKKDRFPSDTECNWTSDGDNVLSFIEKELYLLSDKTIYDPSPAGYVIPPVYLMYFSIRPFSNTQTSTSGVKLTAKMGWGSTSAHHEVPGSRDTNGAEFYTDSLMSNTFYIPNTGMRKRTADIFGDYQYQDPTTPMSRLFDLILTPSCRVNGYSTGRSFGYDPSSGGVYSRHLTDAKALLPVDDSYGPDPAWFSNPAPGTYRLEGGSSPLPSASFSYGRYTVMQADPGLQ